MKILRAREGYVNCINKDEFFVNLIYNENGGYASREAVFSISELSESDRLLLKEGAYIRWTTAYEDLKNGGRKIISMVELLNEKWTKDELEHADQLAKELRNKL